MHQSERAFRAHATGPQVKRRAGLTGSCCRGAGHDEGRKRVRKGFQGRIFLRDCFRFSPGTAYIVADDVVDLKTAEAMIAEALSMLDEANEGERAADERARSWEGRAELGTTLLRAAEDRTDRAQAERQAAERLADTERVARLWWQSSCWQQRQLLQMQLLSRLSMNTERDVSSKQIWLFGRR